MVSTKKVVARFKVARGAKWTKIDKDWKVAVRDEVNGEWIFEVKALEPPHFRLEMRSPGGPSAPPKGTYVFGNKPYRSAEEAKHEANYWIEDIKKGGGIKPTGWKKV